MKNWKEAKQKAIDAFLEVVSEEELEELEEQNNVIFDILKNIQKEHWRDAEDIIVIKNEELKNPKFKDDEGNELEQNIYYINDQKTIEGFDGNVYNIYFVSDGYYY